uniref:Uncharacterized protein n=1 Tax=Setaria digitata TaxID=48799 RepID=A0A915Q6Q8_9BILA
MGRCGNTTESSSQLSILTINQRENIVRKERERRRLIRYQQVRQLSAENAAKIRERVKAAKQREIEELKKRITDAVVQRDHLASSDTMSHVNIDKSTLPSQTPRRSHRHQITREELERAVHRHHEALKKLRRENEREQRRREFILERRRKAQEVANVRSRRI